MGFQSGFAFVAGEQRLSRLPVPFYSDYLWLRAVLLTNATVATVGLGLTIPLAFGSDLIMGKPDVLTPSSIFGALTVLFGFVLVNIGNDAPNGGAAATDSDSPLELSPRMQVSTDEDVPAEDTFASRTID